MALWAIYLLTGYGSIGHDQSWYLYAAKQMLHGVSLYGPRLEDSNPPLIYWIVIPPMFAAGATGLSSSLTFFLYVIGLAACSTAWCYRLLRGAVPTFPRLQRVTIAAAIFFAELNVQRATDLGQREQFMVILVMPYLIAFGLRRVSALSRMQAITLSLVAAIGFCSKPQQILVLLALQVAFYVCHRDARRLSSPQTLGFALVCVACAVYTAIIYLFFPEYPHRVVPLLGQAYWAFGQMPFHSILLQRRFAGFVILAAFLLWHYRRRLSFMPAVLLFACIGGHLASAAQRTGWYYQQIPRNAFLALFGLWTGIELVGLMMRSEDPNRNTLRRVMRWGTLATAAVGAMVLYLGITKIGGIFKPTPTTRDTDTATRSLFESLPRGTAVYVFSTDLIPAFPFVLERDLVWASRRPHLMMLPAIVQNERAAAGGPMPGKLLPPSRVEEISTTLRHNVTDDLNYWHPAYVLVDQCYPDTPCQAITDPNFDMLAWFGRSPEFTSMWTNYVYSRTIRDTINHRQWDVYELRNTMHP